MIFLIKMSPNFDLIYYILTLKAYLKRKDFDPERFYRLYGGAPHSFFPFILDTLILSVYLKQTNSLDKVAEFCVTVIA